VLDGDDRRAGMNTPFETIRKFPAPSANTFHHLAGIYAQTASRDTIELSIYVDGELTRSGRVKGNFSNTLNDGPLFLGISTAGQADPFFGVLDEVAIYNRALTAEEIAAIHAAGAAGKCRNFPFATFAIDRTRIVRDRGTTKSQLDAWGHFALAPSSDGIAPLTEEVQVTIGDASWTVPPGSFVRTEENDGYRFDGTFSGLRQVFIRDSGVFRVWAASLDLGVVDAANPLAFGLRIGNDEGSTNIVSFERERGRDR
jgi:hypothetical protein